MARLFHAPPPQTTPNNWWIRLDSVSSSLLHWQWGITSPAKKKKTQAKSRFFPSFFYLISSGFSLSLGLLLSAGCRSNRRFSVGSGAASVGVAEGKRAVAGRCARWLRKERTVGWIRSRGSEKMGNGSARSLVGGDKAVLWCCLWSVQGEKAGSVSCGQKLPLLEVGWRRESWVCRLWAETAAAGGGIWWWLRGYWMEELGLYCGGVGLVGLWGKEMVEGWRFRSAEGKTKGSWGFSGVGDEGKKSKRRGCGWGKGAARKE